MPSITSQPQFASTVRYDNSRSTSRQANDTQALQTVCSFAELGLKAGLAAAGPLGITAGSIAGAIGGGSSGSGLDPQQQAYLAKMEDMQNRGAELQCSMTTLQQKAQNDAILYQGISNTLKTTHDTQMNTVRNVKA